MNKQFSAFERDWNAFMDLEAKFERISPGYIQSREHLKVRRDFFYHMKQKHGKNIGEDHWLQNRMINGVRKEIDRQITPKAVVRRSKGLLKNTVSLLYNVGRLGLSITGAILNAVGRLIVFTINGKEHYHSPISPAIAKKGQTRFTDESNRSGINPPTAKKGQTRFTDPAITRQSRKDFKNGKSKTSPHTRDTIAGSKIGNHIATKAQPGTAKIKQLPTRQRQFQQKKSSRGVGM